ncbi:hypothetical protein AtubIFM57258_010800 [Aspergillus tubingensis]|nr:hypothetical protein AtubIFM57258_010800 [Aspergillus tubingensis]
MTPRTTLKTIGHHIQHHAARCHASLPSISLAPRLQIIVTKARQGPFIFCLSFYLLSTCLSWLISTIQFSSQLHAHTLSSDILYAYETPPSAITRKPYQWAPPPSSPLNITFPSSIPPIIHRIWRGDLTKPIPEEYINASSSCHVQNPTYEQYIWTDTTARRFIEVYFPWFAPIYNDHLLPVQRVDVLRYFLLWHYGGVYLDPEIGCQWPLDSLLMGAEQEGKVLLPQHWPYGVGNEFIASKPNHPFVIKVALSMHEHRWEFMPAYAMAFVSAGAVLMSRVLRVWLSAVGDGVGIVPGDMFEGTEETFFMRFVGEGPRGDEVAVLEWFFGNWVGWCAAGIALGVMGLMVFGVRRQPRKRGYTLV